LRSLLLKELDASTAASGPHDFAVRDRPHSSVAALASTASHRAFVTMAEAPQSGETRGVKSLICPTARAEYFCAKGWTDFRVICPSGRFVAASILVLKRLTPSLS